MIEKGLTLRTNNQTGMRRPARGCSRRCSAALRDVAEPQAVVLVKPWALGLGVWFNPTWSKCERG